MSIPRTLALAAALLLWCGCAATVPLATQEQEAASQRFEPPEGRALVYVLRTPTWVGRAVNLYTTLDGGDLAALPEKHFSVTELEPGPHTVGGGASIGQTESTVRIDAEAGGVYFVSLYYIMRGLRPVASVKRLLAREGRERVEEYRMAESL